MTSPIRRIRLGMYGPLFSVFWADHPDFELYLAGFITEANRTKYLQQHPGWTVIRDSGDNGGGDGVPAPRTAWQHE